MSIRIIGITGPTGSGKSLLSKYLSESGIHVIDADEVYHSLLVPPSECLNALRYAFGDSVFFDNGNLDRHALSEIVFHNEEKLTLLNKTVLGFVLNKCRDIIKDLEKHGAPCVAIDAPTLIESGFNKECDTVISVICPQEIRMDRIIKRDGLSPQNAQSRVKAQKPDSFYIDHSDYILVNDSDKDKFIDNINDLLSKLDILFD